MCGKSADDGMRQVADRLREAKSLVLTTHISSDGDALGSLAAMLRCARAAGKTATAVLLDPPPQRYAFVLAGETPAPPEQFEALADAAEMIVLLDTCSRSQLEGLAEPIERRRDKTVAIDHHATRDDIVSAGWFDTSASATGLMVLELIERLGWPLDLQAAEAIATAIVSDTGWLRFSNTDPRTLKAMADLLRRGVQPDRLYRRLFQMDRVQKLKLEARALESLQLHLGGRLAVMSLREQDFTETGALQSETENLINDALQIASVELAVMMVQRENIVRVSLRSREFADVASVAQQFGGGGHVRAAGFRLSGDIDSSVPQVIQACSKALV